MVSIIDATMPTDEHGRRVVPAVITIKLNESDVEVANEVMLRTGLTDGVQLTRYCFRAALRELETSRRPPNVSNR